MIPEIELMIDIETLGTKPGAPVLEIACVAFYLDGSPLVPGYGRLVEPYRIALPLQSQLDRGLQIDADTLGWWTKEERAGRLYELMREGETRTQTVTSALGGLKHFIASHRAGDDRSICMWANSPSFDLTLLEHLFRTYEIAVPWTHREQADQRTWLRSVGCRSTRELGIPFVGTEHCALDDATHQIKLVQEVYRRLHPNCPGDDRAKQHPST